MVGMKWENILTYKGHLDLLGWCSYNVTTNVWGFSHRLITALLYVNLGHLLLPMTIKTKKKKVCYGSTG